MADEPTADPTPEQVAAVTTAAGTAVAESAAKGEGEAAARAAADKAIETAASKSGFRLHPDDRKQIVTDLIDQLREYGAFEQPPAPPAPPAPTPEGAAEAEATVEETRPPEKKSWAERFAGL
jgi:hypothetical protein